MTKPKINLTSYWRLIYRMLRVPVVPREIPQHERFHARPPTTTARNEKVVPLQNAGGSRMAVRMHTNNEDALESTIGACIDMGSATGDRLPHPVANCTAGSRTGDLPTSHAGG
jgi:hypothetical protein